MKPVTWVAIGLGVVGVVVVVVLLSSSSGSSSSGGGGGSDTGDGSAGGIVGAISAAIASLGRSFAPVIGQAVQQGQQRTDDAVEGAAATGGDAT